MQKHFRIALISSLIAVSILAGAESSSIVVPAGTVLPVQLSSTINSGKAHPGQKISAQIMQDVPLPAGAHIPRGAKVIGQVVAVRPASPNGKAELSLRFDTLVIRKQRIPVMTHLRAMASMMAVSQAQVPESGPDRGTPSYIWTTDLIGGQVNYHAGGVITQGNEVVGHSTPDGVLVQPDGEP